MRITTEMVKKKGLQKSMLLAILQNFLVHPLFEITNSWIEVKFDLQIQLVKCRNGLLGNNQNVSLIRYL